MKRRKPEPRYITPASIQLGDVVKARIVDGAITVEKTAVVVSRDYLGSMRVFSASDGQEIFRWHPEHGEQRVTLLERKEENNDIPLF